MVGTGGRRSIIAVIAMLLFGEDVQWQLWVQRVPRL